MFTIAWESGDQGGGGRADVVHFCFSVKELLSFLQILSVTFYPFESQTGREFDSQIHRGESCD